MNYKDWNNKIIELNFGNIDLVKAEYYEGTYKREFYKEFGSYSARDSKRKKRPLRIGKWRNRIFNLKQRKI